MIRLISKVLNGKVVFEKKNHQFKTANTASRDDVYVSLHNIRSLVNINSTKGTVELKISKKVIVKPFTFYINNIIDII